MKNLVFLLVLNLYVIKGFPSSYISNNFSTIETNFSKVESNLTLKKLSQKRAESTREWLIAHGIAPERLIASGYGESKLVNICADEIICTEKQHQENRRSEFIIID